MPPNSPYLLQCVVTVDEHFALKAVVVSIRYSAISLDNNNAPLEEYGDQDIDMRSRTLTVTVLIQDVEHRFGGTYECVAKTQHIPNVVVPDHKVHKRTRIIRESTKGSTQCEG